MLRPPEWQISQPSPLPQAPVAQFDLLLSGMAALQDELRWFAVGVSYLCGVHMVMRSSVTVASAAM